MLDQWLGLRERSPGLSEEFTLLDQHELAPPSDGVNDHLVGLVTDHLVGLDYLRRVAEHLGDAGAQEVLRARLPHLARMKRGDFGEILTAAILEQFLGFAVPIKKLRYRVLADDSMHGGDVLAVKATGDLIEGVALYEAKYRSATANNVAVQAHEELLAERNARIPHIHMFVAQRLDEAGHPLAGAFHSYLARRDDTPDVETFGIALVFERQAWSDGVLQNLLDHGIALRPLTIHSVLVEELNELVDSLVARLDGEMVVDDAEE